MSMLAIAFSLLVVSVLYATVGQAGGTAFLAIMAFAGFLPAEMRTTALLLNVVAAGYATWRLHALGLIEWGILSRLTVPALVAAFLGGLVTIGGRPYFVFTGVLLIAAAALMLFRRSADSDGLRSIPVLPSAAIGSVSGFVSGLTGVGGGVFLVPQLIALKWASPRQAARISPPFILANSIAGLAGVLLAGGRPALSVPIYAAVVLVGSALGTAIGLRWMSQKATAFILAAILVFAGVRLLLR